MRWTRWCQRASFARTTDALADVKSRGPDTPTLASGSQDDDLAGDRGKRRLHAPLRSCRSTAKSRGTHSNPTRRWHRGPAMLHKSASYRAPPYNGLLGSVAQTSTLALSELSWMNSRRGSTTSPISLVKMSSASSTSLIFTCSSERASVSSVVSQSCSGFISPRPL
jgi:hypothetical protein